MLSYLMLFQLMQLPDGYDVVWSNTENDKNEIVDMFMAPYTKSSDKLTNDKVGMGVQSSANMKEFARYRQKTMINS